MWSCVNGLYSKSGMSRKTRVCVRYLSKIVGGLGTGRMWCERIYFCFLEEHSQGEHLEVKAHKVKAHEVKALDLLLM